MCDNQKEEAEKNYYRTRSINEAQAASITKNSESHLVYELKQKREYLLRQLLVVQQAIDAVNSVNNF